MTATQAIRTRLSIVSREIERARAGVRRVNNRAAFSTVTVMLVADGSVAPCPRRTTTGRRATPRRMRCACSRSLPASR